MQEHHLTVSRTARYVTLGPLDGSARDVWFALHGYGQLARRFARALEPLDDGSRLVVVPEGLSRYYVNHSERVVGSSWMTSEDRLSEIADYIAYLDRLLATLRSAIPTGVPLTVLGFSQGTATACRWVAAGAPGPARVVLWGGTMPPELDLEGGTLRDVEVVLVRGEQDALYPAETATEQAALLETHGVRYRSKSFTGGHEMTRQVLLELAASR